MTAFLVVVTLRFALSAAGKISWLIKGEIPTRDPFYEVLDVVLSAVLIVWVFTLL